MSIIFWHLHHNGVLEHRLCVHNAQPVRLDFSPGAHRGLQLMPPACALGTFEHDLHNANKRCKLLAGVLRRTAENVKHFQ